VPDVLSGSSGTNTVSHRNRQHDNVMGIAANGDRVPNGVDFWWDEAPQQTNNCWFDNGTVTTVPAAALVPSNCQNTSAGVTYGAQASELLACAGAIESGQYDPNSCVWFRTPPKPSSSSSSSPMSVPFVDPRSGAAFADVVADACQLTGTTLSCSPFRDRL